MNITKPDAFRSNGKFYDWDYGNELPDNFSGTFLSGIHTVFNTWIENGERAFEVVSIDFGR